MCIQLHHQQEDNGDNLIVMSNSLTYECNVWVNVRIPVS